MNHVLIFDQDFKDEANTATIDDNRSQHIIQQLKANIGDTVKVGQLNGLCGTAVVSDIKNTCVKLEPSLSKAPPEPSSIKLLLAMPRPKVLRRLLRSAIELGVKDIHLINSWKVEKSYWQTPWLSEESLFTINCEALSLAKDTMPAKISIHKRFKPFVEDDLAELCHGHRCLLAHPSKTPCPANITKPTFLAIGPEGGFTDYEVQMLETTGFETVSLGQRILRVENAVSAALGRLNLIHIE